MSDIEANESISTVPTANYAQEKYVIEPSIEFKIGNKVLEIEDCEIDRNVLEKFRAPDGIIQISQDELNELENQMLHNNFQITKTCREKTSDKNVSPEDKAAAFEEMLKKQEELGALMLTLKNLHAAILRVMKHLTMVEYVSLSDSAAEVIASKKLNSRLEEYIYEKESYESDDLSKNFDHTNFTKSMSELHENPEYLQIKGSLPKYEEKYGEESHWQFQTLVWMKYRFMQDDVLFFYAPQLEFPNIKDDLVRCPPFVLCDDRTAPQFLRDYQEKIGRHLEREIWKISRFALILEKCSETAYIVEIIKRYLRACIKQKMKPIFARVEQLFLKETWNKDDQELVAQEFFASCLNAEQWEEAVDFVTRWHSKLRDLTFSNIQNPTQAIFKKLPEKFRVWFHVHYKQDLELKDHIVLCSSIRKYSKYYLTYLKSQNVQSFD